MLDLNIYRENPGQLEKDLEGRNVDSTLLKRLVILEQERRKGLQEVETLKAKRNSVSKEIGALKAKKLNDEAEAKMRETRELGDQIKTLDDRLVQVESEFQQIALSLPNIPDPSVPAGKDASSNRIVRKWGDPKKFSFQARDHVELGETLGIIDFERAGKLSGARFSVYFGAGARLERALIQFMLDLHTQEHGYAEVIPPFLVTRDTMTGTGQLPKFEQDLFKTSVGDRDLFLVPTAEVPLTNLYADEILELRQLPIYLTAYTPCFRSEAGSYGKDTRGLIRQHQFQKVELVKFSTPESSMEELEKMTANAEKVLQLLGIPYQTVLLCRGDMGFGSKKTYDIEVWLPGQAAYREISSCSNCGDFQARRAKIRFRREAQGKSEFVHTLNGSGLAVGRTFIAILENYQNEKGEIMVPKVLHKYLEGAPGFEKRGTDLWITKKD